ncbi:unnamed protein product [Blepharisma stoltei]|uniref:EF-hand domain-containing protein n=1 Tax=Blepharisma stoltei TaxID=1481888 RepID=A0AAU9IXT7_9CILI|nr:unnamed protein product [Blepharisma stoltei]
MGCAGSRSELSPEERCIVNAENILQYNQCNSHMVDYCHRKYSSNNEINPEQWRDIVLTLNLKADNTAQNKKIVDFFNLFKGPEGKFHLRHLLVLGIMLSNSESKEKARLLFETRDNNDSKAISKTELFGLVEDMIEISVSRLPRLFVQTPNFQMTEEDMRKYVLSLTQLKDKAKSPMANRFIGLTKASEETVSLANFLKTVEDVETAKLLTPTGIRTFVSKQKPSAATSSKFAGLLGQKKAEPAKEESKSPSKDSGEAQAKKAEEHHHHEKKHKKSSSSSSSDEEKKKKKQETQA